MTLTSLSARDFDDARKEIEMDERYCARCGDGDGVLHWRCDVCNEEFCEDCARNSEVVSGMCRFCAAGDVASEIAEKERE